MPTKRILPGSPPRVASDHAHERSWLSDALIEAVRVVAAGDALLSPVGRRLIGEFAARAKEPPSSTAIEEPTDRQREVMALAAAGLSNEQIATRLVVSVATAKTHVGRAMVKHGVRDRAQLVVLAYETGQWRAERTGCLRRSPSKDQVSTMLAWLAIFSSGKHAGRPGTRRGVAASSPAGTSTSRSSTGSARTARSCSAAR
jgi:DNA-binding CsgD family transcriptional regulator